jgi:hypothetical protein
VIPRWNFPSIVYCANCRIIRFHTNEQRRQFWIMGEGKVVDLPLDLSHHCKPLTHRRPELLPDKQHLYLWRSVKEGKGFG